MRGDRFRSGANRPASLICCLKYHVVMKKGQEQNANDAHKVVVAEAAADEGHGKAGALQPLFPDEQGILLQASELLGVEVVLRDARPSRRG